MLKAYQQQNGGLKGVIVMDRFRVCSPNEVAVRYGDEEGYLGTDWRELCLFDFH